MMFALGIIGCATKTVLIHPPSQEMRENFGRIGLASEPAVRPITYDANAPIVGTTNAARYGAEQAADACYKFWMSGAKDPFTAIAALMVSMGCAAVVAPGGALAGAASGRTEAEASRVKGNIDNVISEIALDEFQRYVATAFSKNTGGNLKILGLRQQISAVDAKAQNVQTLLWLDLKGRFIGLGGRLNPDIRLILICNAWLIEPAKNRVLYFRKWRYEGPRRDHFGLAENAGSILRDDVAEGFKLLAERAVFDLFLNHEPEQIYQTRCDTLAAKCESGWIQGEKSVRSVTVRFRQNWKEE